MTTRGGLLSALVASGLAMQAVAGQPRSFVVRGVVFDSLRGRPLSNASVLIAGRPDPITTDSRGRFRFDGVAPGVYTLTAQHAELDSIGLPGLATRATIGDADREVRLAIPSFQTVWRVSCRGRPPADSGIVFGTVRDAITGATVADAAVELSWSDLTTNSARRLVQRRWRVETRSNARGEYVVCGTAPELLYQIRAERGDQASGTVSMSAPKARVGRRDLYLGPIGDDDSTSRGTVVGTVTDDAGLLVSDARIISDDSSEARSGPDGRFVIPFVRIGTRQFEVRSIGAAATFAATDVVSRDTTIMNVHLRKVRTLAGMKSTAAAANRVFAAEFEARRRSGFGYHRDSLEIAKFDNFVNVLREVPGLTVQSRSTTLAIAVSNGKGGICGPDVFIDGAEAGYGHLIDLFPHEVAAVEVYVHASEIPARFTKPGPRPQCGMILVWTKYGFKNR